MKKYLMVLILWLIAFPGCGLGSEPDYSKTPVFFIHGHGMGPESFHSIISHLAASGYPRPYLQVIQLVPDKGSNIRAAEEQIAPAIEAYLIEINDMLKRNAIHTPKKNKVDLVSHSMGALSARWYAARIRPERVRTWISLGGANHGTNVLCLFFDEGAADMCPAYARNERQSRIQFILNGDPQKRDVDETPYGLGRDSATVKTTPPDPSRSILYVSIRTTPDIWIKPEESPILDGAGGVRGLVPTGLRAEETSPGNILMRNNVGHDDMLNDPEVARLIAHILAARDKRVQSNARGPISPAGERKKR